MARIRTIKPDHWEDEDWNKVSLQSHLLWLAMKNFADDKGVIKDNPVLIKNKAFPTREDIRTSEVIKWLGELSENSFLIPLTYENKGYYVLDFKDEKIDKPTPSILPNIAFVKIREDSRIVDSIPAVKECSVEGEVIGEECITHERDEVFELSVLFFFGFNQTANPDKVKLIWECCIALKNKNFYENFKIQFGFYCEYTKRIGLKYKHAFPKFLGQQSNCFEDGVWNAENWEQKLKEENTNDGRSTNKSGTGNKSVVTDGTTGEYSFGVL